MLKTNKLNTQKKFQHLLEIMSSERFLNKEGLGNEVPFFIYSYNIKDSTEINTIQKTLIKKLKQSGINILNINLYDLTFDILKEEGDWEWYAKEEASISKEELKEELQSILDIETVVIPAIVEKMESTDFNIMFLSGIAEVFPYIRSHNVLNNLQSVAKDQPTIMFFPGAYTHSRETGASLELFGKLHDDKYYRAFNIHDYEV